MAQLTKAELSAAAARAAELSLAADDVAIQTANEPPEGVKATTVGTAGSDTHGAIYSLTRKQVDDALDNWAEVKEAEKEAKAEETETKPGNGRRRRSETS